MSPELMWGAIGLALVILDMLFGSFYLLFLGLGALVTALSTWLGFTVDPTWQWTTFAVVSILGILLFRKRLVKHFGPGGDRYTEHVGEKVKVIQDVTAKDGKVMYRGAEWQARSKDGALIPVGEDARILKTDGIVLVVELEN